jgi:hypothetical protein
MKKLFCVLLIIDVCTFFAQSNFYTVKSGFFTDPFVWNTGVVPDSADNVLIATGDTVYVNSTINVRSISINSNSFLQINTGAFLSVYGNWNNSGKFISGNSTVRFKGSAQQSLGGNSVTTFYNLEFCNAAGVLVTKDVKVINLVTVSQGTVNLNAFKLILLSDSIQTAAIAPLMNGADIAGKITMQRYLSNDVTGWRFLGSPVSTQLSDWKADFITSGFPGSAYPNYYFCSIYSYDETVAGASEYGYVAPTHANDSLKPGKGYWCWVGPTPKLVDVSGIPKKGDHLFSVSFTQDAGIFHDGWNLLSNPYPSAIDWDSPHWTKTGLQDAIYIWDPQSEQYSTYINGIGINGGTNIIASSQAFWIQSNQSNPVLKGSERVKTQQQATVQKALSGSALRLSIKGNNGNDETIISFRQDAQEYFESDKDALKLFTDNYVVPSLCTLADSMPLAINSLPMHHTADIPVKVKVGVSGTYTLTGNSSFFPENRCVYLEDLATGAKINLKNDFSYTFSISDTTHAPRFMVRVASPLNHSSSAPSCSYKSNGKIRMTHMNGACTVNWFDELGNTLSTHISNNGKDSLLNLHAGIYRIKISSQVQHCAVLTETVLVESIAPIHVNVFTKNNACKNSQQGTIQLSEITGGNSPYLTNWLDNASSGDRFNLPNAVYSLVITDSKQCKDTTYHAINSVSQLQAQFSVTGDTSKIVLGGKLKFTNETANFTSLKWITGSVTSVLNDPEFTFSSTGTHTVVLAVEDKKCNSEKIMLIHVKSLKGEYSQLETPHIFQSGENATIEFKDPESRVYNVSVYTADGKLIYKRSIETGAALYKFPLGESCGIYLVTCESKGVLTSKKMFK